MNSVLVDRPLHPEARKLLSEAAEIVEIFDDDSRKLDEAIARVDGVICSAALKMTAERIAIGKNLKVIGRPGAGYDSVDVSAASEYGIPLVYTPDGPTESVAEHVILLMLMLAKKVNEVQDPFRRLGDFGVRGRVTGMELQGKTLGLAGLGRIGGRTAEIASKGLGMEILVYDPFISSERLPKVYRKAESLAVLAAESDVVSLHMPYSEKTHRIFGKSEFDAMKSTGLFINTSRGGVVDEDALVAAIRDGKIGGAGLDVYASEPPAKDNPLLTFENVVTTPHLSSFTDDGKRKMGTGVVQGVLDVLAGTEPEYMVNREIWDRRKT